MKKIFLFLFLTLFLCSCGIEYIYEPSSSDCYISTKTNNKTSYTTTIKLSEYLARSENKPTLHLFYSIENGDSNYRTLVSDFNKEYSQSADGRIIDDSVFTKEYKDGETVRKYKLIPVLLDNQTNIINLSNNQTSILEFNINEGILSLNNSIVKRINNGDFIMSDITSDETEFLSDMNKVCIYALISFDFYEYTNHYNTQLKKLFEFDL